MISFALLRGFIIEVLVNLEIIQAGFKAQVYFLYVWIYLYIID